MNAFALSRPDRPRDARGFTLIELLVVIGLIVLLVGAIGMALRGGDKGNALQGAQSTLVSLFAGTRAKAALHQTKAALLVDADPSSEGYLRTFRVAYLARDNLTTESKWMVDDAVTLPAGIFLVPDGTVLSTGIAFDSWKPGRVTTALDTSDVQASEFAFDPGGKWRMVYKITQYGARDKLPSEDVDHPKNHIVLAPAERSSATELRFSNPDLVRGAIISRYGVLSIVNDAEAFDQS